MRPVRRFNVSKKRSARTFRKHSGRTRAANIAPPPSRGGIRL